MLEGKARTRPLFNEWLLSPTLCQFALTAKTQWLVPHQKPLNADSTRWRGVDLLHFHPLCTASASTQL